MTCECTGVCVYKMACRRSLSRVRGCRLTLSPPLLTDRQKHLAISKAAVGDVLRASAPPLRTLRLCARDLDHAQALSPRTPQPRVLPVRCPHRSALPSLVNRLSSGAPDGSNWHAPLHRSSCEKWPRISCAGHRLRPQPRLGLCSRHSPWLCPPPASAEKVAPSWQGLRARLRRTELPGGTAAAPVSGRCPAGACAFQPRPDTLTPCLLSMAGRRRREE